jgi:hypothetical protein
MDKLYENAETGCCPRFNPAPWEDKEITWEEKLFLKDHVLSFFHIPLNFGKVMVKNVEKIKAAGALPESPLMLSDENSLFGSDMYINVAKEIPGAQMVRISGTFLTKVFEGSYQNMGKWVKEMQEFVKARGKDLKKLYFYYTTCPACAKHYGKNYVVLVAQI